MRMILCVCLGDWKGRKFDRVPLSLVDPSKHDSCRYSFVYYHVGISVASYATGLNSRNLELSGNFGARILRQGPTWEEVVADP